MTLKKMVIRNFQKHKHLEIRFGKRITIISGPSDIGKSTCLRALYWICCNPKGKNARKGATFSEIELEVDGTTIKRHQGKNTNYYQLDGKSYKAVGGKPIPEKIAHILQMDEINFQAQFDPLFWISLGASQLSKELNQIINLEVIDQSLSNISSTLRKTKMEKTVCEERLKEGKDKLKKLVWVKKCSQDLHHLQSLQQKLTNLQAKSTLVTTLLADYKHAAKIGKMKVPETDEIDNLVSQLATIREAQQCVQRLEEIEDRKKEAKRLLTKLEAKLEKAQCPLCGRG